MHKINLQERNGKSLEYNQESEFGQSMVQQKEIQEMQKQEIPFSGMNMLPTWGTSKILKKNQEYKKKMKLMSAVNEEGDDSENDPSFSDY